MMRLRLSRQSWPHFFEQLHFKTSLNSVATIGGAAARHIVSFKAALLLIFQF
jgi:hypothetical protein